MVNVGTRHIDEFSDNAQDEFLSDRKSISVQVTDYFSGDVCSRFLWINVLIKTEIYLFELQKYFSTL